MSQKDILNKIYLANRERFISYTVKKNRRNRQKVTFSQFCKALQEREENSNLKALEF